MRDREREERERERETACTGRCVAHSASACWSGTEGTLKGKEKKNSSQAKGKNKSLERIQTNFKPLVGLEWVCAKVKKKEKA